MSWSWLPQIGWVEISPEEAMYLELEQAGRWRWRMFRIEWFGFGLTLMVQPIGAI